MAKRHGHRRSQLDGGRTPTYNSWRKMVERCTNPKQDGYENYGGSGVTVCKEWRDFANFLKSMGERPEGMTLDRINPYGNYEPSNCRWASRKQQASNKRKSA